MSMHNVSSISYWGHQREFFGSFVFVIILPMGKTSKADFEASHRKGLGY